MRVNEHRASNVTQPEEKKRKFEKKSIVFTGGGTSGHVTPNLALIEKIQEQNLYAVYIGSNGIEKELTQRTKIPFYEIPAGKLRRHLSIKNLIDPLKVFFATLKAFYLLGKIKPKAIFSKGGFVAVPVVWAGYLRKIPIIVHESDFTPGLANKLSFPFSKVICTTFKDSEKFISYKEKIKFTGSPIRSQLFTGDRIKGLKFLNFDENKPTILIMGGSLGSLFLNNLIISALPELISFQVVHICGKGKLPAQISHPNYRIFEYLHEELADILAAADLVISRSGANAVCELLALKKLNLLIPLSTQASRGDQLDNAAYAEKLGLSKVLKEEEITTSQFIQTIHFLLENKEKYINQLKPYSNENAADKILKIIQENMLSN